LDHIDFNHWLFDLSSLTLIKFIMLKKGITYRGVIAVILLSVYLLNPFKLYTPYLSYKLNYNYIAKVLCENKDKPQMNCKGKCHLNKELKKAAEEESQKNKSQLKGIEIEEIPFQSEIIFSPQFIAGPKKFSFFNEGLASYGLKKFTPPPQV
jgi:hypothetical protein